MAQDKSRQDCSRERALGVANDASAADPLIRYGSGTALADAAQVIRRAGRRLAGSFFVARLLFMANLRARHRRALIGYVWMIVPGLVTALIFALLRRASLFETDELAMPYPLFVLSGMYLWQSFADALTGPMNQLRQQRQFLAVVQAPHEAVVLAAMGEVLLGMAVRLCLLAAVALIFGLPAVLSWTLVPLAFVLLAALGSAAGLLASPLAQLYDDVSALLGLVTGFGFFLVPVLFAIPSSSILAANPMIPVMDAARAWMLGSPAPENLIPAVVLILVALPVGWMFSVVSQPHIAARAP